MDEVDYEALPDVSMGTNMLAGALAGITEHSVVYPIDAIKTRMQVIQPSSTAIYSGLGNAVSKIATTEGLMSLWRGVNSVVLGAGPAHALYFGTYEYCKILFGADGNEHNFTGTAAAGACATIAADGFMNPFDVVKQRMQLQGSSFRGISHCATSIFRQEGIGAFYVSYPTTLAMTIPFQMIHFITYEYLSKVLNPQKKYAPSTHIIAGGLAGAAAAAFTTPLDVIKTILQTKGVASDSSVKKVQGISDVCRIVYHRHGWRGFFMGMTPRVVSHVPSTAICWTTYEFLKHFLGRRQSSSTFSFLES